MTSDVRQTRDREIAFPLNSCNQDVIDQTWTAVCGAKCFGDQRKVHAIRVGPDRAIWRKALSGKSIDPLVLSSNPRGTRSLLLMAGEEASTKSPLPPQFRIQVDDDERLVTVTGYGLAVLANVRMDQISF